MQICAGLEFRIEWENPYMNNGLLGKPSATFKVNNPRSE